MAVRSWKSGVGSDWSIAINRQNIPDGFIPGQIWPNFLDKIFYDKHLFCSGFYIDFNQTTPEIDFLNYFRDFTVSKMIYSYAIRIPTKTEYNWAWTNHIKGAFTFSWSLCIYDWMLCKRDRGILIFTLPRKAYISGNLSNHTFRILSEMETEIRKILLDNICCVADLNPSYRWQKVSGFVHFLLIKFIFWILFFCVFGIKSRGKCWWGTKTRCRLP